LPYKSSSLLDASHSTGKGIYRGKGIKLHLHSAISTGKGKTTQADAAVSAGDESLLACEFHDFLLDDSWADRHGQELINEGREVFLRLMQRS
jgi:hypothetical protein